jgi:dTDP-4-amino-4,6-dideoxygalactose transaminase
MTVKSLLYNPFLVVKRFEEELSRYTNSPFVVAVNCCTNALFLCFEYAKRNIVDKSPLDLPIITVPKRTYLSVPQSIMHAGFRVKFEDIKWSGAYQLKPLPIYDSAKRLTSDMYINNSLMCLSFHIKKPLPIGKGGAILTDNYEAYEWFKMARYEGRHEMNYKEDDITFNGWNMYMGPEDASRGLNLLMNYPKDVPDQEELGGYRDLTEFTLFKGM